jgi:hypothetical protein
MCPRQLQARFDEFIADMVETQRTERPGLTKAARQDPSEGGVRGWTVWTPLTPTATLRFRDTAEELLEYPILEVTS